MSAESPVKVTLNHQQWICLLIFVTLLGSYAYFFPRWADWTPNSRMDLTMAIVDQGTLRIDDYYQNTGDYAFFEGHYYSDKAPGPALLGVPFYWLLKRFGFRTLTERVAERLQENPAVAATVQPGGLGISPDRLYFAGALYFVTFCTVAVPSAVMGVILYLLLERFSISSASGVLAVLTYGLLTPAFPYSGGFFSHQQVAALLITAFYLCHRLRYEKFRPSIAFVIGLMLGWAVISEYPAALIAAALITYSFLTWPRRWRIGWTILGGLIPGAVLAAYNTAIYHTPFAIGYSYSPLYVEQHHTGFMSLTLPQPAALWGVTFSPYRGLFFLSPILLLGLWGFVLLARQHAYRAEFWVCLWAVGAFLLFNGSSIMWEGGFAVGARYLLPMLPFLVLPLGFYLDQTAWTLGKKLLVAVFELWSLFAVWVESIGGQGFPDWTENPLFRYSLPKFLAGDVARNLGTVLRLSGWASLIPLALLLVVAGAMLFLLMYRTGLISLVRRRDADAN